MTADREIRSIHEVADHCLGKMLDKNKNQGTLRPYLRNLNVRWFNFDLSDVLKMRFEDHERERYTAKKGDLIVCEGGYPGRAAIWPHDEPVYLQKALHRVRFKDLTTAKWFLYLLYLSDMNGSLRDHFTGAEIQHFTGEALKRFRLPLPPPLEQKRIVAILDEAFEGIDAAVANTEKNLANARELLACHVSAILEKGGEDWLETTLGTEVDLQTGFAFRSTHYTNDLDGIRLLRGDNIVQGELRWDDVKRWPIADRDLYREYELEEDDMVLAMDRTWVKAGIKLARITREDIPALLVQRVARMRYQENLSKGFLYYLL